MCRFFILTFVIFVQKNIAASYAAMPEFVSYSPKTRQGYCFLRIYTMTKPNFFMTKPNICLFYSKNSSNFAVEKHYIAIYIRPNGKLL